MVVNYQAMCFISLKSQMLGNKSTYVNCLVTPAPSSSHRTHLMHPSTGMISCGAHAFVLCSCCICPSSSSLLSQILFSVPIIIIDKADHGCPRCLPFRER